MPALEEKGNQHKERHCPKTIFFRCLMLLNEAESLMLLGEKHLTEQKKIPKSSVCSKAINAIEI